MALTKTQTAIMARAKAKGFVCAEMAGGRGPEGGNISFGVREYKAVTSLIKAGLLALVNTQREMSHPGNGATIHHYLVSAKPKEPAS